MCGEPPNRSSAVFRDGEELQKREERICGHLWRKKHFVSYKSCIRCNIQSIDTTSMCRDFNHFGATLRVVDNDLSVCESTNEKRVTEAQWDTRHFAIVSDRPCEGCVSASVFIRGYTTSHSIFMIAKMELRVNSILLTQLYTRTAAVDWPQQREEPVLGL